MKQIALKLINLIALLIAGVWLYESPGWGTGLTFLGFFAALIALEVTDPEKHQANPDCDLFQSFLNVLPSYRSIAFIRDHDLGAHFKLARLDDLDNFHSEWDDAEHEFLDETLEKKRKKLHKLIEEFLRCIAMNTFPIKHNMQAVYPEEKRPQSTRFVEAVRELEELADQIIKTHQDLIRTARKRLRV